MYEKLPFRLIIEKPDLVIKTEQNVAKKNVIAENDFCRVSVGPGYNTSFLM